MKVLHLIGGGDVGGAKIHVLSLVKELSKYIDVKLISLRPGSFADDAIKMGINVEIIKSGNIYKDIKRIVHIVKTEGFEIIHSHGAKANMISVASKFFIDKPNVSTVHSDYRLDYLQNAFKQISFGVINTISLRYIDYYVAVSKNFKQMLINRNFSHDKIYTVYNGINFNQDITPCSKSEFIKNNNLDISEDTILVGILVRLHPVKDLTTFIKAAKEIIAQNKNVQFLIGGDGEDRKSLEKTIINLGLSSNVHLLGFVNAPYEFMNCIDINVLTSISESFPYSILEGTLFKKPTVSSDVGGISDLIENEKNGFLFNAGDYKGLASCLLKLINDPNLRTTFGERLHEKARLEFSLDSMCKTQINIYSSILEREDKNRIIDNSTDVIISGYYGFNNIGDDAMLMAIIKNLRKYKPDIKITVLSKNSLDNLNDPNINIIDRFNIGKIISVMSNSKMLINGGGSLIQDNTSSRSLFYYLFMIWLAKRMNMKVMLYANGIGPLKKKVNRLLTSLVLNQVDIITLREDMSLNVLKFINVSKPFIKVTADPALTIDISDDNEVLDIFEKEKIDINAKLIGFSVRDWYLNEEHQEIIARIADYIYVNYGLTPVFLPMHYPKDIIVIKKIVSKMKQKSYIVINKYTAPQILKIISKFEILIGMRLHALIFAANLGIPVVGLSYEPKVEGFMNYIEQNASCPISALEFNKLKDIFDNVWTNREQIKDHLCSVSKDLRLKADDNAKIAIDLLKTHK